MRTPMDDEFREAKERAEQQKRLERIPTHNICNGRKLEIGLHFILYPNTLFQVLNVCLIVSLDTIYIDIKSR